MEKSKTTSMVVLGVGAIVAGTGRMIGGEKGAAISGFGLAHVALGLLDMFRPSVHS